MNYEYFAGLYIDAPTPKADGEGHGFARDYAAHFELEDCYIDLSKFPPHSFDETVAFTCGASATLRRCVIVGGGKHILIGSGDAAKRQEEEGNTVTFSECVFMDFSRRGPEVQSGMTCILDGCLIANWGVPGRFHERAFAAWAHHGGRIYAQDTIFMQDKLWHGLPLALQDLGNHIGTAFNYRKLRGLIDPSTWIPGVLRGLVATDGGLVTAKNCGRSHRAIHVDTLTAAETMARDEYIERRNALLGMKHQLYKELCPVA